MELPDNIESLSREEQYALFGHLMEQRDRPMPLRAGTNAALMTARFMHFDCAACDKRHSDGEWLDWLREMFRRVHSQNPSDVLDVMELVQLTRSLYTCVGVDEPSDQLLASLKVTTNAYLVYYMDDFAQTPRALEIDIAHSTVDPLVRRVIELTVGALQMEKATDDWVPVVKFWDGFPEAFEKAMNRNNELQQRMFAERVGKQVGIDLNWN